MRKIVLLAAITCLTSFMWAHPSEKKTNDFRKAGIKVEKKKEAESKEKRKKGEKEKDQSPNGNITPLSIIPPITIPTADE